MAKNRRFGSSRFLSLFMLFFMILVMVSQPVSSLLISDILVRPSSESAEISWKTDVGSNSTVLYGQDLLDSSGTSSDMVMNHSVALEGLSPSTPYIFKVISNDGSSSAESPVAQFVTNATVAGNATLFLDVKVEGNPVPLYYNGRIDFEIDSVPGAEITLKKDGQIRRHAIVGSSGRIYFNDFDLVSDPNIIEIEATLDLQTVKNSYSIILDDNPPTIETSGIPSVMLDQKFIVNGTVDEPVTLQIISSISGGQLPNVETKTLEQGSFSEAVPFQNGDGEYTVQLIFTDQAGNSVTKIYNLLVDTSDPTLVLSPSILELSPSYVNKVRIKGTTEPGATVVVFVNNRTTVAGTFSTNVVDILKGFGTLVSEEGTYSAVANSNGEFAIDVLLSQEIKAESYLGQRHTSPPSADGNTPVVERTFTTVPAWKNEIKVIAIDRVGRTSAPQKGDILFTTCDYGGDWEVTIEKITPELLQQQHLIEGIGSFGFNYRLKWVGPGNEADAKIAKAEIKLSPNVQDVMHNDRSEVDKGYELGKLLVGPGDIYYQFNDNVMIGSAKINFRRYPSGVNGGISQYDDLKVLLEMDIDYSFTNLGQTNIAGRQVRCIPVSIAIDRQVNVSRPTGLLKTSVKYLNKTIEVLDATNRIMSKVQNYAFYASIFTHIVYYGSAISQRAQCFKYSPSGVPMLEDGETVMAPDSQECQDDDQCAACWEAIKKKESKSRLNHWVSDRIFCPSIPSVQEYARKTVPNRKYFFDGQNISATSACLISSTADDTDGVNTITADNDACKKQYEYEWRPACVGVSNLYKYSLPDQEEQMNAIERLADTASNICKATKVDNNVIYIDKKSCCDEHSIAKEKGDDFCFYIKDPTVDGQQLIGIYEADYEDIKVCVKDPEDPTKCLSDPNDKDKIMLDNNRLESVFLPQGVDPVRIDDINNKRFNNKDEKMYNKEMVARCIQYKVDGPKGKYVIEPTNGLIRSFQCACIPAFNNYIKMYKNMAEMTRDCFNELLITGDSSAGFCKAVLTMYVCDLVYDAIKCGGKYFSRQSMIKMNDRTDENSDGTPKTEMQGIGDFFGSMSTAGQDVSKQVQSRYGNSATFRSLFAERTLVHTACVGAFTGDWNLDLEGLFSSASDRMVVESIAEVYPATRQFQTSSPFTGRVDYIYHFGVWLIAGADLTFNAKLICSNDNTCDYDDGVCDCMRRGHEEIYNIGEISGYVANGGTYSQDKYILVEGQEVRYDTILLEYKYIDNEGKEKLVQLTKKITATGYTPPTCSFDMSMMQFLCSFDVGNRGFLSFGSVIPRIKDQRTTFNVGDELALEGSVIKRSPENGEQKPGFLYYKVLNRDGIEVPTAGSDVIPINNDGTNDLGELFSRAKVNVLSDWFDESNTPCFETPRGSQLSISCGGPLKFSTRLTFKATDDSSRDIKLLIATSEGQKVSFKDSDGAWNEYTSSSEIYYTPEGMELKIDSVPVTISGPIVAANLPFTTELRSSARGPSDFTLVLSLHYGEQNNPNQIDLKSVVTNGAVKEEYPLEFFALPASVRQPCPVTPMKAWEVSSRDYGCVCGEDVCYSRTDGTADQYCYFHKCVDNLACINFNDIKNLGDGETDKMKEKLKIGSGACYCSNNQLVPAGSAANPAQYCCLIEGDDKLTLQTDVSKCILEKKKYLDLIS